MLDTTGTVVRDTGVIASLNPGGGVFGPDGRYYAGLRSARTILALSPDLTRAGEHILPAGVVPFPRGFGFDAAGRLFLASGIGPDGKGDDAILASVPTDLTRQQLWSITIQNSAHLTSSWRRTAMSSYPASARSARPMRSRASANITPKVDGSSACFPPRGWLRSASRAGYASVAMAISTVWLRTKWLHSIFRVAAVLAPSCSFRDCTGKRLFSFLITHARRRRWGNAFPVTGSNQPTSLSVELPCGVVRKPDCER